MRYLLITIVALVLATTNAFAFTWEGELDPNEFDKWEVINIKPTPKGFIWVFIKNPDENSPINIVAMAINSSNTLLGYHYFKYSIPHVFTFDSKLNKYVEKHLTDEEKNGCMKCHKDKMLKSRAI